MLSILYGLFAAVGWGAADFTGGLASRRTGAYRTVLYSEVVGLFFIISAVILTKEGRPAWPALALAGAAGAIGSTGLLMLYHALTTGEMSIATPVSALMAAAIPVLTGTLMDGFPGMWTFLGFGLSLAAIWLISREEGNDSHILTHISELRLPLLAGIGFGTYFILMHSAAQTSTIWPMLASRSGGMLIMLVYIAARQDSWRVTGRAWPYIVLNSLLDAGGNAFYLLASQAGRMDVAAVLSSLYPAATVLMAALILKERVARSQAIGILLALVAIVFLTL
ncbi:MAG: EamA family transporter [Candidatus Villigracilaceae bacterium]